MQASLPRDPSHGRLTASDRPHPKTLWFTGLFALTIALGVGCSKPPGTPEGEEQSAAAQPVPLPAKADPIDPAEFPATGVATFRLPAGARVKMSARHLYEGLEGQFVLTVDLPDAGDESLLELRSSAHASGVPVISGHEASDASRERMRLQARFYAADGIERSVIVRPAEDPRTPSLHWAFAEAEHKVLVEFFMQLQQEDQLSKPRDPATPERTSPRPK